MTNHIIHAHEKGYMLVLTVSRTSAVTWAEEIWFPLWSRRTIIRSEWGVGLAVKEHRPIQRIPISHGEVVGAFSHEHRNTTSKSKALSISLGLCVPSWPYSLNPITPDSLAPSAWLMPHSASFISHFFNMVISSRSFPNGHSHREIFIHAS